MRQFGCLTDIAAGAQLAWRMASEQTRQDVLKTYSLVEILLISPGAEELDIWSYPRAVTARIILDHGCREEGRRRGHTSAATIEEVVRQAQSLGDFRSELETKLSRVEPWADFIAAARARVAALG